jgi:hypothetical protein
MDLENNTNFTSPCPHTSSPCLHGGGSGVVEYWKKPEKSFLLLFTGFYWF